MNVKFSIKRVVKFLFNKLGFEIIRRGNLDTSFSYLNISFYENESSENYRKRLIKEIIGDSQDIAQAYQIILDEIKLYDEPTRSSLLLDEVRYLLSYKLMPKAPKGGRLIDIWDIIIHPLCKLKGWTIEAPVVADGFNLEFDILPYENDTIDGFLLCEVLEHFAFDPMWCLIEINRVLRSEGVLLISVPNTTSWFSIYRALVGLNPNRYPYYSSKEENRFNSIHAREYCVEEIRIILNSAGFEILEITTMDYGICPPFIPLIDFDKNFRGETIFCLAKKIGVPKNRTIKPIYTETLPFEGFYNNKPYKSTEVKPPVLIPPTSL